LSVSEKLRRRATARSRASAKVAVGEGGGTVDDVEEGEWKWWVIKVCKLTFRPTQLPFSSLGPLLHSNGGSSSGLFQDLDRHFRPFLRSPISSFPLHIPFLFRRRFRCSAKASFRGELRASPGDANGRVITMTERPRSRDPNSPKPWIASVGQAPTLLPLPTPR
jgi:hypothetical protein